ncbi:CopD family protein [Fictibacillus sp. WQ 8-8]|uniref:copper resistance D family protein n=1 Tax=unclassified Fictibacillus TaxID=2644029 RepID=UPI0021091C5E|nr:MULTISPECIES: CopD family protein [unclassified Fictibacillus]MCQ6264116.1 CopD family protein [Fictibacillus sp. WQ 8-8]MED2971144.1 CopD family protein [Fictibacillus sp. B-59209]
MLFVAKAVLYLVFSLFIGTFLLYSMPVEKRPFIHMHKKWLLACIFLIPVAAFSQVLELALSLGKDFGFWPTLNDILFSFDIGKGWFFILALSFLLFVLVYFNDVSKDRFLAKLSLFIGVMITAAVGYTSHAATLNEWGGLAAHSLHFLAVTSWTGTLLAVSWLSKDREKIPVFLKWFTPFALVCLSVTIGAGIWLMSYIVPQYYNSWMMNYGQALLIKHVLLVVVIFYALVNSIWIRRKMSEPSFSPYRWMRLESVFLLFIFIATSVMVQQEPPHDVSQTLAFQKPSQLFTAFIEKGVHAGTSVHLGPNALTGLLAAGALLLLLAAIYCIRKSVRSLFVFLLTAGSALVLYLAVMFSVSI